MLDKIFDSMEKYNKDVWIMYNCDDSDNYFNKFISDKINTSAIAIFSKSKVYIIAHELDNVSKESLKEWNKNIEIKIYKNQRELDIFVEDIIADLGFPNDISLSYSTMSDKTTDILSHGDYIYITKLIRKPYTKYSKKVKFSSIEKVIYDLTSKKTNVQIERLKYIAAITIEILEETLREIKIGMSEIKISELTREITHSILNTYMGKNNIISYDFAWDNCPIVLTGVNLTKGGHSLPSEKKLNYGETIYFDFGINVKFDDGDSLNTDLQRMAYVLKNSEKVPPKSVQKVFNILINSIEEGMETMKPGVKGYIIDNIVRQKILKEGYPDYNHATGHPVGNEVHDSGAIISIKTSKRASLELIENGVYTLEPRVNINNGGSIEEMILVTKYGGVPICKPQKELYIIKP